MIQKCIFLISASALLVACKADCPDKIDQKNNEEPILTLANSSVALKELIKSKDSHIRGFTLGEPLSKLGEKDEDLAEKYGTNILKIKIKRILKN